MTEPQPFETPVDPSGYGRWRAETERARQEGSAAMWAEMSTGAGIAAHRSTSADLRAAHQGLFPGASGQELAAEAAARPAIVGSDYGGRPLERNGGAFTHHLSGPAPARVSLVSQNAPPGYQRDENPLVRWSRENR